MTATDGEAGVRTVSVCHVVAYRDPDYVRTRTIRAGLASLAHCQVFEATNTSAGLRRYIETIAKLLRIRAVNDPEVYILGFRGHEIWWLVRLITLGRMLVFDEFMSPSDSLINEGRAGLAGRLAGRVLFPLEKFCLRYSDRCLTDTQLHKRFISHRFSVPQDRIDVVYVGADATSGGRDELTEVANEHDSGDLQVLFYGTFLPLHGVDVILRACELLKSVPVRFEIIGGKGKSLAQFRQLCSQLKLANVAHQPWVDFSELRSKYIPRADLCLGGPFGGTPQARRVITGKTFQFLAQGKPAVVGEIDEPAGFVDRRNCLLVRQADPQALADALEWASLHRSALPDIGANGLALFEQRYSVNRLAVQLSNTLDCKP